MFPTSFRPSFVATLAFAATCAALAGTPSRLLAADAGAPPPPPPVVPGVATWDPDAAVIAGTACMKGVDAFALSNGSDFSVVFSNLGITLDENAVGQLSERQSCTVRLPVRAAEGFYPSQITQRFQYGARTTANASGNLTTTVSLFGNPVTPLNLVFPQGIPIDVTSQVESRTDVFPFPSPWALSFCRRGRQISGNVQVNFLATGERTTTRDVAVLFVDGRDLRYDVQTSWSACTR
ncbi:MAG: hypothetical protein U0169_23385 [Polyangiaceae bacterium]